MAGYPETTLAYAELDVVTPVGGDVEAGSDETNAEADHQQHEPRLHCVVELVPDNRVTVCNCGGKLGCT